MLRVIQVGKKSSARSQGGFTIIQMVITLAIIGVVSTFGILGITSARAEMRIQNSARTFAVYIERARSDAVRRHAAAGSESTVETFGPGTNYFNVRMDFNGTGVLTTRTFTLDTNVEFSTVAQTAVFDWRGRIPVELAFQVFNGSKSIPVDISGSGDVTIDSQIFADLVIPDVVGSAVASDVVPDPTPFPPVTPTPTPTPNPSPTPTPTPTPNGNGNGNGGNNGNGNNGNGNPTPTPTPVPTPTPTPIPTPTPTPTPTGQPPPCTSSVTPTTLTLSQSQSTHRSGTAVFTLTNGIGVRTIKAAMVGQSLNLSVSPTSISGSGSATVTIASKTGNGNRGTFLVNISATPSCGTTQQVTVTVSN